MGIFVGIVVLVIIVAVVIAAVTGAIGGVIGGEVDEEDQRTFMNYRSDKYGNKISLLGYGCMRFTKKGSSIDIDKATEEVKFAIDN